MQGIEECQRARQFWSQEWTGKSFMAVGLKDPVLEKPVMDEPHTVIRGCPPPLYLEQAGHFVQEWGQAVAEEASKSFGK